VPGLTIVGSELGADEVRVADAVCDALRERGSEATAFVPVALGGSDGAAEPAYSFEVEASPLVAASHAGREIDPGALMDGARRAAAGGGVLVSALSGGVLAPLTPRYAVRDLARDVGAPVVLAVPAKAGASGQARVAREATRAAGLHVAGVVLTGWPESPPRVLLDERRLLAELLGHPVEVLPPGGGPDAARRWPLDEWLEPPAAAEKPAAGAPAEPAAAIVLEPYAEWESRPVGDPRGTPRPQIMDAMLEIVAAEGPMRATRAYALYNRASGGRKLTSVARAPLSSAAYWLSRENKVVLTPESEIPWQGDDLLRLPDTPAVRVRELGPRVLEEVPLDEIAELIRRIRAARGVADPSELKRAVLSEYGLVRLTARADEYLTLAIDLAE
jgi:dethiobiotin synthetase